ncbi:MAG: exodeoxyribonuclease V subunit alpha [Mariprofundus sp.]|nr:exodeoxyribonuclease V subunit alpha [Mariprofundus sp.]
MSEENRDEQLGKSLGYFFGRFIAEQTGSDAQAVVVRSAAWLSEIYSGGDVCLDLHHYAGTPWPDRDGLIPDLASWRAQLLASTAVGEPGAMTPMIVEGNRLYLKRFRDYECSVAAHILARLQLPMTIDQALLRSGLEQLFSKQRDQSNDQMLAAVQAISRRFAVISGGPGTGKTTSLVKVLALLLQQKPQMQIRLAAPTGKAAARMVESIRNTLNGKNEKQEYLLQCDAAIRALIPLQASTLHRLLGYSPRGYRHDQHHPLQIDCLVVDEASMLDLPMAARLLEALPTHCHLILLGDRDQLASVDAGNVLGDITGHGRELYLSSGRATELVALTGIEPQSLRIEKNSPPIADAIGLLRTSYRFNAESDIGRLARAVNQGSGAKAVEILSTASNQHLSWSPDLALDTLMERVVDGYTPYLQAASVQEAMKLLEKQRVLCAVRHGPVGVESINQAVAHSLQGRGLLDSGELVQGMPLMVTANSYELQLYNGDVGLLWRNKEGSLRCYFFQSDQTLRDIPVQSLPQYEQAWAMTVHKSQGSEFENVFLLLPEEQEGQSMVSRELLYTAITRARTTFTLHATSASIHHAAAQLIQRSTGLAARLGW